MLLSRPLVYLLLPILAFPASLAAQPVERNPVVTGADVMQSLRAGRGIGAYAGRTLQQLDGPVSRAVQDALADSMVAYVRDIENPGAPGGTSIEIARSIVLAIGIAGAREQTEGATPYAGAGERLLQLALIVDRGLAAGTVYHMYDVADRSEARRILRTFATTSNPVVHVAIKHLGLMGPEGMNVLRSLWEQDAVTVPYAKQYLQSIAGHEGWSKRPSSPRVRRS